MPKKKKPSKKLIRTEIRELLDSGRPFNALIIEVVDGDFKLTAHNTIGSNQQAGDFLKKVLNAIEAGE